MKEAFQRKYLLNNCFGDSRTLMKLWGDEVLYCTSTYYLCTEHVFVRRSMCLWCTRTYRIHTDCTIQVNLPGKFTCTGREYGRHQISYIDDTLSVFKCLLRLPRTAIEAGLREVLKLIIKNKIKLTGSWYVRERSTYSKFISNSWSCSHKPFIAGSNLTTDCVI